MGKHPTSITGIKIPLPIGTGWGRYLPAILNSGFQVGATEAVLQERQGGQEAHKKNEGAKGSVSRFSYKKHFYEIAKELRGPREVSCGPM